MGKATTVTVIGGGGTAIFMAAYLTIQGHEVTVCEDVYKRQNIYMGTGKPV